MLRQIWQQEKGYYSAGVGASTRKYIDPVVLFASVSANYGFKESGLNQRQGSRIIEEFEPGVSGGFAFGFAYSFNYDVSDDHVLSAKL